MLIQTKLGATLAEMHGYRGIEFGVQAVGEDEWKWAIYPKIGSDIPAKHGKVSGTRAQAVIACKDAIDSVLSKRR